MAGKYFSGGEKLQAVLAELSKKVTEPATLRAGFLEGSTYPDGTSVPMVAAINELGRMVYSEAGNYYQMPRPFFRGMISKKSPEWGGQLGKLLVANDYDAKRSLGLMGETIKGELQESIAQFSDVPLAPATIKAKGFDKQLVDTGHMMNSVGAEVAE